MQKQATIQQEILSRLIDAITDLVCHHGLHTATKGDAIVLLARAHLFVALRQLDGFHKGLALQFIYEANLIGAHFVAAASPTLPVIPLNGADLREISLPNANLAWACFTAADIARADLHGACLICANLSAVDLIDANLAGANLCGANLLMADITGADLDGADLRGAMVSAGQVASARTTHLTRLPDSL